METIIKNWKVDYSDFERPEIIKDYVCRTDKDDFRWTAFLDSLQKAFFKNYDEIKLVSDVITIYENCISLFETPIVLNPDEEKIINVYELALYYAEQENTSFTKESAEFQQLIDKHYQIIKNHERIN